MKNNKEEKMESLNKSPRIRKVTAIPFALKEKIREGAVVPPQAKAYIKAMKAKKEEEMVISVEDATFEIDDNDIIRFKGTSGKLVSNEDFEKRREAMRQREKVASGMDR